MSLQEARERHQEARKLLSQGVDPMAAKKAHTAAGKERAANSFEAVAREWHEIWKTDKHPHHAKLAVVQLGKHVFPYIGGRPISELSVPEVLTVLRRIEEHSVDPRLIEFQMTHSTGDPFRYNRARYLDDRRKMMQTWADYLDGLKTANSAFRADGA